MTVRGFGLVMLLLGLVLVGALWATAARHNGPTSQSAQHMETQASEAAAAINLLGAVTQLTAYHAAYGTFVGTPLPPSWHVDLVRADASSYCLQTVVGASVEHIAGPGSGTATAGPC